MWSLFFLSRLVSTKHNLMWLYLQAFDKIYEELQARTMLRTAEETKKKILSEKTSLEAKIRELEKKEIKWVMLPKCLLLNVNFIFNIKWSNSIESMWRMEIFTWPSRSNTNNINFGTWHEHELGEITFFFLEIVTSVCWCQVCIAHHLIKYTRIHLLW